MTFTSPDTDEQPTDDERSGAGPMLTTLVGILLSLVALGIILFRVFPSDADDGSALPSSTVSTSETTVVTTAAPTTVVSTTVVSTTVAPDVSTSVSEATTTSSPAPDAPPEIVDVAVRVGSTTADVSFTTNTCVNARYDYRGASTGRHEGDGYPDAANCWTEHLALLGEWTDPLVPDADYVVDVTVVDAAGRMASATVEFTTAS